MEKKRVLAIVLSLCLMMVFVPVNRATATDYVDSLWLRYNRVTDQVQIDICADTMVSSGVITITYDAGTANFEKLVVDETYVLAYAVNDKEAGTIKISWVGTDAQSDTAGHCLMKLKFVGDHDLTVVLAGTVYDLSGKVLPMTELDFSDLEKARDQACALKAEDYTADSFSAVTEALDQSFDQLYGAITQAEVDALTAALQVAMENLVVYTPEPPPTEPPTEPTEPTEPPTEPKPTEPKPTEPKPTEPAATQPEDPVSQEAENVLLIPILVGCCVPIVVAVVLLKKRGKK